MSTHGRTVAARLFGVALLLMAALPAAGCGGGGGWSGPGGTLEVRNDPGSFEGIDAVEISTPFGPVDHFDVFLAPGEVEFIDLIPDSYDVDLLWSDATFDTFLGIDIFDGLTTVVTGFN